MTTATNEIYRKKGRTTVAIEDDISYWAAVTALGSRTRNNGHTICTSHFIRSLLLWLTNLCALGSECQPTMKVYYACLIYLSLSTFLKNKFWFYSDFSFFQWKFKCALIYECLSGADQYPLFVHFDLVVFASCSLNVNNIYFFPNVQQIEPRIVSPWSHYIPRYPVYAIWLLIEWSVVKSNRERENLQRTERSGWFEAVLVGQIPT